MADRQLCSQRHLLHTSVFGLNSIASAMLLKQDGLCAVESPNPIKLQLDPLSYDLLPRQPTRKAPARAVISLFMMGGFSQIDLFDPIPQLVKRHGQIFPGKLKFDNMAQASREIMKPAWKFHRYAECGMELSELLPLWEE